jgi:hypothetical protein
LRSCSLPLKLSRMLLALLFSIWQRTEGTRLDHLPFPS